MGFRQDQQDQPDFLPAYRRQLGKLQSPLAKKTQQANLLLMEALLEGSER